MKKNQKNPFHGKWMVLRMECVADDGTWFVYEPYGPGEFIWKFSPLTLVRELIRELVTRRRTSHAC